MKFHSAACMLLSAATLAAAPLALAQKITAAEQAYVGGYTHGTVDTVMRLVLLDDRTFCVAFTGGALDYLGAGNWKADKKGGITLREVKPDQPEFVAFAGKDKPQDKSVAFEFDGYSLSNAEDAVFAMSNTDVPPTSFRPLFPEGQSHWSASYRLPAIGADKATYFYVGFAELDQYRKPLRLKVIQYKTTDTGLIRVGFNQTQTMSMMNSTGKLVGNVLHLDDQAFGKKDVLPAAVMDDVRQSCINPVLRPDASAKSQDAEEQAQNVGRLKPSKVFYVPLKASQGAPLFNNTEK
jgi:hypothetical protein